MIYKGFLGKALLFSAVRCDFDPKRFTPVPSRPEKMHLFTHALERKKICPQSHSSDISPTFIHGWQKFKNIVLDLNLILCTCRQTQFFFLSRTRLASLAVEWHLAHISGIVKFQKHFVFAVALRSNFHSSVTLDWYLPHSSGTLPTFRVAKLQNIVLDLNFFAFVLRSNFAPSVALA